MREVQNRGLRRCRAIAPVPVPCRLACLALIAGILLALGGCAKTTASPETTATTGERVSHASPSLPPRVTSTPTATPAPPTPRATPTATTLPATPTLVPPTPTLTPVLSEVDLGVPGAECYSVEGIVSDADGGMLYAVCGRTELGPGMAVVAVDSTSGKRLGPAPVGGSRDPYGEYWLALDAEARRLYLVNHGLDVLVVLDTGTLEEVGRLPDVKVVAPARGEGRFYVLTGEGLAAYRASDLEELAALAAPEGETNATSSAEMVYNPATGRLYVENDDARLFSQYEPGLSVLSGEDLSLETTLPVTGVTFLAVDGQANQIYGFGSGGRILVIDGESHEVTEGTVDLADEFVWIDDLLVHEGTNQVHVAGTGDRQVNFWLVLDGDSLQTVRVVRGLPSWKALAPGPEGRLLTVREGGEVVMAYDPASGQSAGRLVLGQQLLDAGVDPGAGRVYALDSAGGLTVLDGSRLEVVERQSATLGDDHPGLLDGEAVLRLDPERRRLFVADGVHGRTLALELDTLEPVGGLDVAGPMAVDAEGGRLFVGDEHIYVYDTATLEPVGDEPALRLEGSPDGMYSAPWPGDVVLDQGSGRLFIRLHSDEVKPSFAIVSYTEFDPDGLEALGTMRVEVGTVAHSPVVLKKDNRVWLSYGGHYRHGLGAYADDYMQLGFLKGLSGQLLADEERLFLLREHSLLVLDPERGYPVGGLPLVAEIRAGLLDEVGERFYLWGWDRLASITKADLLESVTHPQPGLVPEDAGDLIVPSPSLEEDGTLFAVIPDTLETRSEDSSETWRPYTGIYRSKDGGETWQMASWGIQNYTVEDLAFDKDYEGNHTLFAVAGALFRSEDDGKTWQPFSPPDLAFVSDRTGDKEIYTMHYGDAYLPFGTEPLRLTEDPADDDNPAWSPDGERLVFQSDRSGNLDLWIMNWDGTELVQLTSDGADDSRPTWSPDSQRIAFVSLRDGSAAGYLINAPEHGEPGDETSVLRLRDLPSVEWFPHWSPEGWQIAFRTDPGGDDRVLIVDRDGTHPLEFSGSDDGVPDWLASGTYHVYASSELTGNSDLYHVYDTGPAIRRLTTDPANETAPAESHGEGTVPVPTPTPTPTPKPAPPAADLEALLYGDDFSDPDSGWEENDGEIAKAGYRDDEYWLSLSQRGYVTWVSAGLEASLDDFVIEVDARAVTGTLNNIQGLLVRTQPDSDGFYWFQISSGGYYRVDLRSEGEWSTLVATEDSDAIHQGLGATNHLQVICDGARFYFYVNGVFLTLVTDDSFRTGDIGLGIGANQEPGVVVHFDNLRVYALEK